MRQILYHLPILLTAMLLQTVATNAMLPGMHIQQALSKQSTDSLSATLEKTFKTRAFLLLRRSEGCSWSVYCFKYFAVRLGPSNACDTAELPSSWIPVSSGENDGLELLVTFSETFEQLNPPLVEEARLRLPVAGGCPRLVCETGIAGETPDGVIGDLKSIAACDIAMIDQLGI
nr:hypothetical protein Iba_chr14aCG26560 [Ipomoea batatas]